MGRRIRLRSGAVAALVTLSLLTAGCQRGLPEPSAHPPTPQDTKLRQDKQGN